MPIHMTDDDWWLMSGDILGWCWSSNPEQLNQELHKSERAIVPRKGFFLLSIINEHFHHYVTDHLGSSYMEAMENIANPEHLLK